MNKNFTYIIIGLIVVALIYFGFFNGKRAINDNQQIKQSSTPQWETKTDEQPPVTVKVTPVQFGKNSSVWKFDIAFETHSGSLDEDPTKVVTLSDDKGNTYQPISWDGAGPGGHHREGILLFNAITPSPGFIELNVTNVGGVPERLFKWNLE